MEELRKSLNERQERKVKEVKKTIEDLKIEIEAITKTQTEAILEMEKLGKWTKKTDAKINNRMEEIEDRLSGIEDMTEEIDSPVRENIKARKVIKQNF